MKYFLTTIFFIFTLTLSGQIIEEEVFFYNGDKKHFLQTSPNDIYVTFANTSRVHFSLDKKAKEFVKDINQIGEMTSRCHAINAARYSLKKDIKTKEQRDQIIKTLLKRPDVEAVYPVLLSDGEPMMISNTILYSIPTKTNTHPFEHVSFEQENEIEILEEYTFPDNIVRYVKIPKGENVIKIANKLYETGLSNYAQPNFTTYAETHYVPNDDSVSGQWYLDNDGSNWSGTVDADADIMEAWDITKGSSKVKVAVIELGGFDYNHTDGRVTQPYDAEQDNNNPINNSLERHGTAVMGCVSAQSDNLIGIAGTGYNTRVVPINLSTNIGGTNPFSLTDAAITRAANHVVNVVSGEGVFVVSNSWGRSNSVVTSANQTDYSNMIDNSRNGLGAVVMASSGNADSNNSIRFPASHGRVIGVGASSPCDTRKSSTSCDGETNWGSSWGDSLEIMAPGVKIMTLDVRDSSGYSVTDYAPQFNGTSSACPIAAGITALVFSMDRCMTREEAEAIIMSTTNKIDNVVYASNASYPHGTWSRFTGYGRINAYKAVLAVISSNSNLTVSNTIDGSSKVYASKQSITVGPNYFALQKPQISFKAEDQITFKPYSSAGLNVDGKLTAKITEVCIDP